MRHCCIFVRVGCWTPSLIPVCYCRTFPVCVFLRSFTCTFLFHAWIIGLHKVKSLCALVESSAPTQARSWCCTKNGTICMTKAMVVCCVCLRILLMQMCEIGTNLHKQYLGLKCNCLAYVCVCRLCRTPVSSLFNPTNWDGFASTVAKASSGRSGKADMWCWKETSCTSRRKRSV